MVVRRRNVAGTQGLTISEIVSREIDPVLCILLLTEQELTISEIVSRTGSIQCYLLQTEHRDIVTYLTQLITSWSNQFCASHPSRIDSGPAVTPFPIGTGGGAWSDIRMDPS